MQIIDFCCWKLQGKRHFWKSMIISNVSQSGLLELEKFLRSPVHIFHSAYKSFFIIIDEGLHKRCGQRACRGVLVPSYNRLVAVCFDLCHSFWTIQSALFHKLFYCFKEKILSYRVECFCIPFCKKGQGLMKCLEPQNCWIAEADG